MDIKDLVHLGIPLWDIALRTIAIYIAMLVGLRAAGKREVGQFTLPDLVLVLLVANAVQPAMTGPDTSLVGGLLIIVVLLATNWMVVKTVPRSQRLRKLFSPSPTVIAQDGRWLTDALRREGMDVEEAEVALREHGLLDVSQVKLMVLEPNGVISVVPADSRVYRSRRRR